LRRTLQLLEYAEHNDVWSLNNYKPQTINYKLFLCQL
jgi:hypothetical protein